LRAEKIPGGLTEEFLLLGAFGDARDEAFG
jgi:hypothetical protein